MRSSLLLHAATRMLMPLLLVYSLFLLYRGHNAPGGGFVGGLVAAAAFVLYALTAGVPEARRALGIDSSLLLSLGLGVALISGIPAVLLGEPFMTAQWGTIAFFDVRLTVGTPLLFDIGVFLAVLGVVLTIVFTLAETTHADD